MKGSYILIIRLSSDRRIQVGWLRQHDFSSGYYAYVGSAIGGLKPRLLRHLKKNKTPRWHIDYLTERASIRSIIMSESVERNECKIAEGLETQFASVAGFGSSGCGCTSHLFFAPSEEQLKSGIERTFSLLRLTCKAIQPQDICRHLGTSSISRSLHRRCQ